MSSIMSDMKSGAKLSKKLQTTPFQDATTDKEIQTFNKLSASVK